MLLELFLVSKVISLLFNIPSGFVIAFLPRSKHLLISWLQSTVRVVLSPEGLLVQSHDQWTFVLGTLLQLESGMRWTTIFHLHQVKVFSWESNVERRQGAENRD